MILRNLQLASIVVVLLVVVYGMNVLTEKRQKAAQAEAKQVERERQAAEAQAEAKNSPPRKGHGGPAAFALPKNSGPATAPVKLEVFLDNSNSCHQSSLDGISGLREAYGTLLRIEWCSTSDPKMSVRADKLALGCEAGLAINGKVEYQVSRNGGKMLVKFRGPTGEKYRLEDVYAAINQLLAATGRKPPARALAGARVISSGKRP